jgi:hypothetical protein
VPVRTPRGGPSGSTQELLLLRTCLFRNGHHGPFYVLRSSTPIKPPGQVSAEKVSHHITVSRWLWRLLLVMTDVLFWGWIGLDSQGGEAGVDEREAHAARHAARVELHRLPSLIFNRSHLLVVALSCCPRNDHSISNRSKAFSFFVQLYKGCSL